MPTREEKIAFIQSKLAQSAQAPEPTREEKIAFIQSKLQEKTPELVSGVRQFAQGASANFSDEMAGGVESIGRALGFDNAGGPMKNITLNKEGPTLDLDLIKAAYLKGRDHERASLAKDFKDNPGVSGTANLFGAVVSPVNKVLPGSSLLKSGAAIGAISGLGGSESDSVGGMIVDSALGGVIGAGVGKAADAAIPLIQRGMQKTGETAMRFAEGRAAKALGANKSQLKRLGPDKVRDAARAALDEGIVTPLSQTEAMAARAQALKERGGKMMGEVYDQIDNASASTFNPLEVATAVDKEIGGFYRSPINRGETNQLENTLESILMRGEGNIPIKEAQTLKEELGKVANWKNNLNITDKEKMAREAYGIVNRAIDDAAEKGAETIGKSGLKETLQQGKRLNSQGRTAGQLLEDKAAASGNNLFGLTDTITAVGAGGYGASTGDWDTALAIMAVKKGAQKYGNQLAATSADAIAKKLLTSPKLATLAQTSPQVFRNIVIKLRDQSLPLRRVAGEKKDKGPEKWAQDGFEKLRAHGAEGLNQEELMKDKKTKDLLIQASDLEPGTQAMDRLQSRIRSRLEKGN